jgi:aspartate/methionine/tyrosine aminotransferase
LARAREESGPPPFDLTNSNPTRCGLAYPNDILDGLADRDALVYRPDPRGPEKTRRAIAAEYRSMGINVDHDRIVLTASTSEAYGLLLRLLADPGDSILVPAPSYPLFELIGRLDAVELVEYPLDVETEWRIDVDALGELPGRCRAIALVHPNNPTGSYVHPDDAATIVTLCRDRRLALIVDEVFLPYPLRKQQPRHGSFAATRDCLCFALGGLSKWVGLPQLKLAWIAIGGPEGDAAEALDRLCHISDAYLSVSASVALATPQLLEDGRSIRRAISDRCVENLHTLKSLAAASASTTLAEPAGGWNAILRYPKVIDEESLCIRLLSEHGVAVHPGYFFGFQTGGWLVLSLLPPPEIFGEGVRRILDVITDLTGISF